MQMWQQHGDGWRLDAPLLGVVDHDLDWERAVNSLADDAQVHVELRDVLAIRAGNEQQPLSLKSKQSLSKGYQSHDS